MRHVVLWLREQTAEKLPSFLLRRVSIPLYSGLVEMLMKSPSVVSPMISVTYEGEVTFPSDTAFLSDRTIVS